MAAEPVTIATLNVGLDRAGPGLLLRDILAGKSKDIQAAARLVAQADADVLVLTAFDYDAGLAALTAFDRLVGNGESAYPYRFALRPNTGRMTPLDLDGDGRTGGPRDAQGYGLFSGQAGMAILSRLPVEVDDVRDLSALLWREMPHANLPRHPDGSPFPSSEAEAIQRLSTTAHWDVPLRMADGRRLRLLVWYATPPVFDGPEDRNGKRAADEARLWMHYLDGGLLPLGFSGPTEPVVIAGDANLDPDAGEGDRTSIAALLSHPRLQDPVPRAADGTTATALWPSPPGALRVDYVLPDAAFRVLGSGLLTGEGEGAPIHRLVWGRIELR